MKTLLFRSFNYPGQVIEVQEDVNGMYYLPAAVDLVPPELNMFSSIDEVEKMLDDKLELIIQQH